MEALCLRFIRTETNHWIPSILPLRAYIMFSIEQVPAGPLLFKVPWKHFCCVLFVAHLFICMCFLKLQLFPLSGPQHHCHHGSQIWKVRTAGHLWDEDQSATSFLCLSDTLTRRIIHLECMTSIVTVSALVLRACLSAWVDIGPPSTPRSLSLHLRRWKHLFHTAANAHYQRWQACTGEPHA